MSGSSGGDMVQASSEFFDSYAEPHRRRPSAVDFPCATYLMSFWHPRRFQQTFADYVGSLFCCFVGMRPLWTPAPFTEDTASELGRKLFGIYDFRNPSRRDERLVFDFQDHRFDDLKWRVEVHREFVTIVAFVGLRLVTDAGVLTFRALNPTGREGPGFSHAIHLLPSEHPDRVTDGLFDGASQPTGLESHAAGLFGEILAAIDAFCERASVDGSRGLPDSLKPTYFAKFFGCILPWTIFAAYDVGPRARPWFPELNVLGRRADESGGQAETARFLDRIWPDLCGDFLNSERNTVDPSGLRGEAIDDRAQACVACHLQNGHALYISSLGSRRHQTDDTALHYLVLYQDHEDWQANHGPSGHFASHPAMRIGGRLSRLVGRLHDVGVMRLAALRQVSQLKNFAQYLGHVENELQRYNPGKSPDSSRRASISFEDVDTLRSQMLQRAEEFEESVVNRSTRAAGYFAQVKLLAEDLGIVPIPRWQAYDLFIRRRLFATLNEVSNVADRYQAVQRSFNTIYQVRTGEETRNLADGIGQSSDQTGNLTRELTKLQEGAGLVALMVLIYYAADVLTRGFSAAGKAQHPFLFGILLVALAALVAGMFVAWPRRRKK